MSAYLLRNTKALSLVAGFLFAFVGSLWSFVIVDRLGEQARQLSDIKVELQRQIASLNGIASDYFIANQQGDLIFILRLQSGARHDVADLVYRGNMLDRATPVRNMIGALALAKQLDYRTTYDAYAKLNDEARANLSPRSFGRLKQAEKAIITKGQDRVPLLLNDLFQVETAINANEAKQKQNRVLGIIASNFGAFLLLCANLIATRAEAD
ncbi:MAG: hypothetical protein JO193_08875 [Candidatus Eremiobacteraeota bacterium]|nr:hypothetical protein [Candidatus Eremiobacteraeota bacterium]MBV9972285.1 hypothetical protein [Candidatus Eremiobacteraeota bacterium]